MIEINIRMTDVPAGRIRNTSRERQVVADTVDPGFAEQQQFWLLLNTVSH